MWQLNLNVTCQHFAPFSFCTSYIKYFSQNCIKQIIAELAERSPIIIQNSSNPSSRKNLVIRPYKVPLLTCVVNCTAGTPTPQLCQVVQWSVHWPGLDVREKKIQAPLLGLAKSIYYSSILAIFIIST